MKRENVRITKSWVLVGVFSRNGPFYDHSVNDSSQRKCDIYSIVEPATFCDT